MTHTYDAGFYERVARVPDAGAQAVLTLVGEILGRPNSVLDIGCGRGSWLRAAKALWPGVEILGVDHPDTPRDVLEITEFEPADLTQPLALGHRFDLAISLEVAEHLDAAAAERFVANIAAHADRVLFSAAIPGQGGVAHVNEQWPDYWISRFAAHGLACHDVLRAEIWEIDTLPWWYRQNAMLFARELTTDRANWGGRALVHPGCLAKHTDPAQLPVSWAAKRFLGAARHKIGI